MGFGDGTGLRVEGGLTTGLTFTGGLLGLTRDDMVICSDTDVGGGGMMNDIISSGVSSIAGVTILVGGSIVTFTTEKQQEQLIIKCQHG